MPGRHRNLVLDQELDALVREDARQRGITVSAAMRDGLRAYYQVAGVGDRAWREAYLAAYRELRTRFETALAEMPELAPDDFSQ